jgi:protein TonB
VDDRVTVTLIDPPPPIPVEPKPAPVLPRDKRPKPLPAPVRPPRPPAPQMDSALPTPMPAADPGPPPRDDAPATAADAPPLALAYLSRTRVAYPKDALQRRDQGTVILRVLVGSDGLPRTIEIERSSGSRSLDNAARDAVRRWTFQPGTRNGVATALWARVPIKFDLLQPL